MISAGVSPPSGLFEPHGDFLPSSGPGKDEDSEFEMEFLLGVRANFELESKHSFINEQYDSNDPNESNSSEDKFQIIEDSINHQPKNKIKKRVKFNLDLNVEYFENDETEDEDFLYDEFLIENLLIVLEKEKAERLVLEKEVEDLEDELELTQCDLEDLQTRSIQLTANSKRKTEEISHLKSSLLYRDGIQNLANEFIRMNKEKLELIENLEIKTQFNRYLTNSSQMYENVMREESKQLELLRLLTRTSIKLKEIEEFAREKETKEMFVMVGEVEDEREMEIYEQLFKLVIQRDLLKRTKKTLEVESSQLKKELSRLKYMFKVQKKLINGAKSEKKKLKDELIQMGFLASLNKYCLDYIAGFEAAYDLKVKID